MKKVQCSAVLLLVLSLLAACSIQFSGSRISNESQLVMKYNVFNQKLEHTFELEKGDVLRADIVSESGLLNITLQLEDADPIYHVKDVPTCTFEIPIEESGTYQLTLIGIKARGSVGFFRDTGESEASEGE